MGECGSLGNAALGWAAGRWAATLICGFRPSSLLLTVADRLGGCIARAPAFRCVARSKQRWWPSAPVRAFVRGAAVVASERQLPYAVAVRSNLSPERTRSAQVARFAGRRLWRAAQLQSRQEHLRVPVHRVGW